MPLSCKRLLRVFLPVTAVVAAWAASTQVSTDKPIINFRLPTFTADGHRSWLVRGSEAMFADQNTINVRELTLSIFSGKADEKVETMILSPKARVQTGESVVTGEDTIRVINDQFEATGSDWRYAHKEKRVNIARNVRVVFNSELKDFLK
jgi:lipopolysaccharide export system protein LptC